MNVWVCHCQQRNPLNVRSCLRLGCNGVKPARALTPATPLATAILAAGPL
jgi:hypothetical protein